MIPEITGRDDELEALLGHLAEAMKGHGRLVLVSGEAGIGKTTLVDTVQERSVDLGFISLIGRCIPGVSNPFLPFREALKRLTFKLQIRQDADSSQDSSVSKVVSGDSVFDEPDSEKIYFQVLNALKENAARRPIMIRLEDLHWVDSASIQLFYFLARNIRSMRVLMVGTYRTEDLQKTSPEAVHPLVLHLQLLKNADMINEIELRELDLQEMRSLTESMLGHPMDPFLLERVYNESHGNPLFVVETIKLLLGNGSIRLEDDVWRSTIKGRIEIPSTVTEVVIRRLEKLSREQRRIIDCAAVIGERFEPNLVEGCLKLEKTDLLDILEDMQKQQQLIVSEEQLYKFDHETIRRVAYEGISSARRRELHRLVGLLLEESATRERRYSELSYHFFNAKEAERCVRYSLLAGDETLSRGGAFEAIPYFQRALDIGPGTRDFDLNRVRAMEGLGDAYSFEGDAASASKLYEDVLKESLKGQDRASVLRKLAECWAPIKLGAGSKTRSLELCAEARAIPEIDADEEGEIGSLLVIIAMLEGDWEQAKVQANMSEDAFKRSGNNKKLALQLVYNSDVFISTGEIDEAFKLLKEAEELNKVTQSPVTQSEIDFHYGVVNFHRGRAEAAMKHYEEYIRICRELGYDHALSVAYAYQSMLMASAGDFESAFRLAQMSREYALKIGVDYHKASADAALAHACFNLRQPLECQKYADEAAEIGSKFDATMKAPTIGMIFVAAAESSLTKNDWDEAERLFKAAIAMFHACAVAKMMEALASSWYGDALYTRGQNEEAAKQFKNALGIFALLGNEEQATRCQQALEYIAA
jgi:tetratricopeptide (TPR) repeat protein